MIIAHRNILISRVISQQLVNINEKIKVTLQVLKKTEIKSSVTIQIKFRNCLTTKALDMKSSTYLKNLYF